MPCGWEGNRCTGRASQTSVVYPPTGSRPKEGRWGPRLHSSWAMAHFTLTSMSLASYVSYTYRLRAHWRNFALKTGGDQWRGQVLVSGGTTIEAPKVPSRVGYGEECPLPSRLGGLGASWAPPAGSGAEPRPLSHFLHILGHRTLLVARKIRFSCQSIRENWYFIWKYAFLFFVVHVA